MQGATINNLAGASFTITGPGQGDAFINFDGSAVSFTNAGSLVSNCTGSTGIGVPFSNSGSMAVNSGALGLGDFSSSGTVRYSPGAVLGRGTLIQAGGSITLNGGTITGSLVAIIAARSTDRDDLIANVTNSGLGLSGRCGYCGPWRSTGTTPRLLSAA